MSDDRRYGKATRDETGQPIRKKGVMPEPVRHIPIVNQVEYIKARAKQLMLDGFSFKARVVKDKDSIKFADCLHCGKSLINIRGACYACVDGPCWIKVQEDIEKYSEASAYLMRAKQNGQFETI